MTNNRCNPEETGMKELMAKLGKSLIAGQTEEIKRFTEEALTAGMSPHEILEKGMTPQMEELGERFSKGDAFLPELLLAAHNMKAAMGVLKPAIAQQAVNPEATLVIGTVAGDIHDLGKGIVRMMFESAAFRVVDMGVDVSGERFLEAYGQERPDLVGLSSLLTTTMAEMEKVIKKVRGEYPEAKFIIGGAPLRQDFADKIGADGYAPDAPTAVKVGKKIVGF
jgi:5-methyltetrahydrofolate--homocysteine methyltransferase